MLKGGMSYSIDLRKKVIGYIEKGGSRVEASRNFGVSRKTIYHWFHRENLSPTPAKTRRRKLDKLALAKHVRNHPDALLRERAAHFGVHINAIWVALGKMEITKKNDTLRQKRPRTTHRLSPKAASSRRAIRL